ncbi:conserved hypothetical protein [Xenorhabdus nematophila F1]|nr:conserved hypothetical protein [Xenorhabdus nematophila F1]CEE94181.1 hypothetical protein XNA1_4520015 [Xenorhabdus nematophila str. Anatoliense]CEF30970.1 hypothetical protein XNW1_30015 [Xenorhabdus nematophila str. Websteri]CEF33555.1 hypothetical protein XNW1_4800015 [Xenorhabdus nematophila str. Websteri]CEK21090.1 hypothetical protein XNC2_0086 [Xenorhabdus nematophila AN6/1]
MTGFEQAGPRSHPIELNREVENETGGGAFPPVLQDVMGF